MFDSSVGSVVSSSALKTDSFPDYRIHGREPRPNIFLDPQILDKLSVGRVVTKSENSRIVEENLELRKAASIGDRILGVACADFVLDKLSKEPVLDQGVAFKYLASNHNLRYLMLKSGLNEQVKPLENVSISGNYTDFNAFGDAFEAIVGYGIEANGLRESHREVIEFLEDNVDLEGVYHSTVMKIYKKQSEKDITKFKTKIIYEDPLKYFSESEFLIDDEDPAPISFSIEPIRTRGFQVSVDLVLDNKKISFKAHNDNSVLAYEDVFLMISDYFKDEAKAKKIRATAIVPNQSDNTILSEFLQKEARGKNVSNVEIIPNQQNNTFVKNIKDKFLSTRLTQDENFVLSNPIPDTPYYLLGQKLIELSYILETNPDLKDEYSETPYVMDDYVMPESVAIRGYEGELTRNLLRYFKQKGYRGKVPVAISCKEKNNTNFFKNFVGVYYRKKGLLKTLAFLSEVSEYKADRSTHRKKHKFNNKKKEKGTSGRWVG